MVHHPVPSLVALPPRLPRALVYAPEPPENECSSCSSILCSKTVNISYRYLQNVLVVGVKLTI